MKTLDEVIKAMENCYGPDAECCDKCQYTKEISAGSICLKCDLEDDALHYLKEFQGLSKMWNDKLDKEQENQPLDWETLKQMEGKPVWMEYEDGKGGWVIVGKFFSLFEHEELDAYVYMYYLHNKIECSKELYGSYWKAYRKERK